MKDLLKMPIIINAVLFQLCWFACVLGSAKGLVWPAVMSFAALALFQLQPKNQHPSDVKLLLVSIAMGIVVDSIWVQSGMMVFTESSPSPNFAPLWILFLWAGFALTVNHSLGWLKKHWSLPFLVGAIGGPLSYFAGLKFGAVEYLMPFWLVSCALALAWGVSLQLLVWLAGKEPLTQAQTA